MGKLEEYIVKVQEKKLRLDGYSTVECPRKITEPLKARGIDLKATVEGFLTELLFELDEKTSKQLKEIKERKIDAFKPKKSGDV